MICHSVGTAGREGVGGWSRTAERRSHMAGGGSVRGEDQYAQSATTADAGCGPYSWAHTDPLLTGFPYMDNVAQISTYGGPLPRHRTAPVPAEPSPDDIA